MAARSGGEIRLMIGGAPYQIRCDSPQHEAHLRDVAAFVDSQMADLAGKSRVTSTPKVAVLTALNLADEVLRLRQADARRSEAKDRLIALEARLQELLAAAEAPAPEDQ